MNDFDNPEEGSLDILDSVSFDEPSGVKEEEQNEETKDNKTENNPSEEGTSQNESEAKTENENPSDDNKEIDTEKITVNIYGNDIEVDSVEEAKKIIEKMQDKGIQRPTREQLLMEQSGLNEDEIAMLVDAKNGDTAAALKLVEQLKISEEDLENIHEAEYKRKFQITEPDELELVAQQIVADKELEEKVPALLERTPEDFRAEIMTDPTALRFFAKHVKDGLAEQIIPLALKKTLSGNISFYEAYSEVGKELTSEKNKTEEGREKKLDEREKKTQAKKQAQIATKANLTPEDIWGMSDEEFNKMTPEPVML